MNPTRAMLLIIALGLTAACGQAADARPAPEPTPTPEPTPAPPAELPLTFTVSGGIAGISDTLEVDTAGAWTLTHRNPQRPADSGQLSDGQLAELRRLLADPGLVNVPEDPDRGCADFFRFTLVTKARTVRNGQCGEASPAFLTLIDYLREVTGM